MFFFAYMVFLLNNETYQYIIYYCLTLNQKIPASFCILLYSDTIFVFLGLVVLIYFGRK